MIPVLLHGRLFGGETPPPPPVVTNPPGWDNANYFRIRYSQLGPLTITLSFTVASDGTWTANRDGFTTQGSWVLPTGAGAGNAYKVRFTVLSGSGAGVTVVNQAPTPTALTASRVFSVSTTQTQTGVRQMVYRVRAEILSSTDVVLATGEFTLDGTAEVG